MEHYYIAALNNGGLAFYRVKESEVEDFRKRWEKNGIHFIVPVEDFHKALCGLI